MPNRPRQTLNGCRNPHPARHVSAVHLVRLVVFSGVLSAASAVFAQPAFDVDTYARRASECDTNLELAEDAFSDGDSERALTYMDLAWTPCEVTRYLIIEGVAGGAIPEAQAAAAQGDLVERDCRWVGLLARLGLCDEASGLLASTTRDVADIPLSAHGPFVAASRAVLSCEAAVHVERALSGTQMGGGLPEAVPEVADQAVGDAPEGFVRVEAGTFTMGSPLTEVPRVQDEVQHPVTIGRPLYVQRHEVTQGEWRRLLETDPTGFPECGDDCPVESVNFYEAVTYANALSRAEGLAECYSWSGQVGRLGAGCETYQDGFWCQGDYQLIDLDFAGPECEGFRLPTEAEWEYVARAGSAAGTYEGDLSGPDRGPDVVAQAVAWYNFNSGMHPHPVGQRAPNAWGLYDVLGNVWEWVWDWYGPYPTGAVTDPVGPASGVFRILRGSGYNGFLRTVRLAFRYHGQYGVAPTYRGRDTGFRLVRTVRE